jgi:peptidoglycan/LPS O-acetylase OafA/YrhL
MESFFSINLITFLILKIVLEISRHFMKKSLHRIFFNQSDSLNILRGIACLGVVWYHVMYPGVIVYQINGMDLKYLFFTNGSMCVWIFFILSGYLIGKSFFNKKYALTFRGMVSYGAARILKIIPAYYLAIILLITFLKLNFDKNTILQYMVFLAPYRNTDFGIGHLWYVSVQMYFYALAPVLFLCIRKTNKLKRSLSLIILIPVFGFIVRSIYQQYFNYYEVSGLFQNIFRVFITNMDLFLFGFALNLLTTINSHINPNSSRGKSVFFRLSSYALFLGLIIVSNWTGYHADMDYATYKYQQNVLLPLYTTIIVGYFITVKDFFLFRTIPESGSKGKLNPWFPLEILSFFSYEIYLLHPLVIWKLDWNCKNICFPGEFFVKLCSVLAISIIISLILKTLLNQISFRKTPSR